MKPLEIEIALASVPQGWRPGTLGQQEDGNWHALLWDVSKRHPYPMTGLAGSLSEAIQIATKKVLTSG